MDDESGHGRPSWLSDNVPADIISSDVFKFKVKLTNGAEIAVDIASCVAIDYDLLEEQMSWVPEQYNWFATIYSEVRAMVSVLEMRIRVRRGVLTEAALKEARDNGFKLTEKQVLAIVESDDMLMRWQAHLVIAQKNCGKLWHMLEALKMKGDMLRSLAGFKRQERAETR